MWQKTNSKVCFPCSSAQCKIKWTSIILIFISRIIVSREKESYVSFFWYLKKHIIYNIYVHLTPLCFILCTAVGSLLLYFCPRLLLIKGCWRKFLLDSSNQRRNRNLLQHPSLVRELLVNCNYWTVKGAATEAEWQWGQWIFHSWVTNSQMCAKSHWNNPALVFFLQTSRREENIKWGSAQSCQYYR